MRRPANLTTEEFRRALVQAADDLLEPQKRIWKEHRLNRIKRKAVGAPHSRKAMPGRRYALPDQGVYVIGSAGQPVKVGVAKDAGKRLGDLQVGSPHQLRIYAFFAVAPGQAFIVEREAHERLADYRMSGEWFDHDPYDAADLVKKVIADLGVGA